MTQTGPQHKMNPLPIQNSARRMLLYRRRLLLWSPQLFVFVLESGLQHRSSQRILKRTIRRVESPQHQHQHQQCWMGWTQRCVSHWRVRDGRRRSGVDKQEGGCSVPALAVRKSDWGKGKWRRCSSGHVKRRWWHQHQLHHQLLR